MEIIAVSAVLGWAITLIAFFIILDRILKQQVLERHSLQERIRDPQEPQVVPIAISSNESDEKEISEEMNLSQRREYAAVGEVNPPWLIEDQRPEVDNG